MTTDCRRVPCRRLTSNVSPKAALVTLFFDMDVVRRRRNAAAQDEASAPPAQYASILCSSLRLLPLLLSKAPPCASLGLLPLLPCLLRYALSCSCSSSLARLEPLSSLSYIICIICFIRFFLASLSLCVQGLHAVSRVHASMPPCVALCVHPGVFVSRYHM